MPTKPHAPSRIYNWQYLHNRPMRGDELPWERIETLCAMPLRRPVVLVNGAFDLLHSGHMRLIFKARRKAGIKGTVVCALDSDGKIRASKGPGRPVMTWIERATALGYMPIDYVVEIDGEKDMEDLIYGITPSLRIQGVEYADRETRFPNTPKAYVAAHGMHTGEIIRRCRAQHDNKQ